MLNSHRRRPLLKITCRQSPSKLNFCFLRCFLNTWAEMCLLFWKIAHWVNRVTARSAGSGGRRHRYLERRANKSRRERPRLSECVGENRKLERRLGCFARCLSHPKVPRLEGGRALRRPQGPSPSSQGCALRGVDFTSRSVPLPPQTHLADMLSPPSVTQSVTSLLCPTARGKRLM